MIMLWYALLQPCIFSKMSNKCIFKIYSFLTAWDKMVLSFYWTAQAHKHGNNKCFKVSGALSGRKLICIITASFITTFFLMSQIHLLLFDGKRGSFLEEICQHKEQYEFSLYFKKSGNIKLFNLVQNITLYLPWLLPISQIHHLT